MQLIPMDGSGNRAKNLHCHLSRSTSVAMTKWLDVWMDGWLDAIALFNFKASRQVLGLN